jgi:hypothetical protein
VIDINALIASAIPVQPPDDWFRHPDLSGPTPIRVDENGRVYGHVASWDTEHIGMPMGTRPPRSRSNYAYFKTGEILTSSGALVPVGQLTLAGGHASLSATAAEAARHYDDTKSAIADVTVGEDPYGIWVAGALRPAATPEQIRALRASAPSGDWRMINGRLEMVAVCQVNVPGFPIPRALTAGGSRLSLVAAGSTSLLAQVLADQEFEARLQRLESLVSAREQEKLALVASAAKERVDKARQARLARAAELAQMRVRDPERYRRETSLLAAVSQAKRDKAAEDGHALPDGSFPINTEEDLSSAIQAYGRAKDKDAAKRHIMKRARAMDKYDSLPEDWKTSSLDDDEDNEVEDYTSVSAAGNFKHLDKDFLSRKAEEQPRDNNGRFVQTGAFLRWKEPGKPGYQFGQVLGRKVGTDGKIEVRLADSNTVIRRKPDEVEVIRAILPADQVDNADDRGIPYRKKEGKGKPKPSPSAPGSSIPSTDPTQVDSVPDVGQPGDENPTPQVGDRVAAIDDGTDLGTVTKADDPTAIEVTDDGGVVTVYDSGEIVVVPAPSAPVGPGPSSTV